MGAIPASVAATAVDTAVAMVTVADIRHLDSQYPWAMETTAAIHRRISGTPDTVDTQAAVAILLMEGSGHGTTPAIWIITHPRLFLTVVTSTMCPATMMCIARATGIVTAIDFDRVTRLSA